MKKRLMLILMATVLLCGCRANSEKTESNANNNKKEQYAIIQNCEDGTDITIMPDHENYDEMVKQFTYAATEENQAEIPEEATQLKSIVFYQAPTETVYSSDKADRMKPLIKIDIYVDGDTQYAVGYLSSLDSIKFSFKMPEDLIELVESLEKL